MTRFLIALLTWLLASMAHAACDGTDLRPTLSEAERTELTATTRDAPFATGNHWRAERGDAVLHLIGTLHLSDPRLDAPLARFAPIVEGASLLLLEMTKVEEARLQADILKNPEIMTLVGTTLPEIMTEADWNALSAAAATRGLPPFVAAKMQPWYLSMVLALPTCLDALAQLGAGLDARLQDIAIAANVATRALEPHDTIFRLFADMPLDEQIEMLNTSLGQPANGEDQFATLLAAYFEEAHYQSWHVTRILARRDAPLPAAQMDAAFDQMEKTLLIARNAAWIPVILDALNTTDGPVVAAFGAGHLGGADGILSLLAAEGFTLSRAPF